MQFKLERIYWDIVGFSEVRKIGENLIKLSSGYLLYYRELEDSIYRGVGFLVNFAYKEI